MQRFYAVGSKFQTPKPATVGQCETIQKNNTIKTKTITKNQFTLIYEEREREFNSWVIELIFKLEIL